MGVVGLLVAMLINLFLQSPAMQLAISAIGVLLFAGLTAYDTQKIKSMYAYVAGTDMMGKVVIMGALNLYLDFINMFTFLLQLHGRPPLVGFSTIGTNGRAGGRPPALFALSAPSHNFDPPKRWGSDEARCVQWHCRCSAMATPARARQRPLGAAPGPTRQSRCRRRPRVSSRSTTLEPRPSSATRFPAGAADRPRQCRPGACRWSRISAAMRLC